MNQNIPNQLSPHQLNDWLHQESQKPYLIDVREAHELEIAKFPAVVLHCPLSQSSNWLSTLPETLSRDKPVVVICHSGVRSWDFGVWLLDQGLGIEVWNLDGGIDAWSRNVDSGVPRY